MYAWMNFHCWLAEHHAIENRSRRKRSTLNPVVHIVCNARLSVSYLQALKMQIGQCILTFYCMYNEWKVCANAKMLTDKLSSVHPSHHELWTIYGLNLRLAHVNWNRILSFRTTSTHAHTFNIVKAMKGWVEYFEYHSVVELRKIKASSSIPTTWILLTFDWLLYAPVRLRSAGCDFFQPIYVHTISGWCHTIATRNNNAFPLLQFAQS